MPITETIGEQIVQAIVTALKAVQRPTYNVSADVQRVSVIGNGTISPNKDVLIEVVSRAPVRDYTSGYVGRSFYNMVVLLAVNVKASSRDTNAVDTIQARVLADITKIVEANRQWGGLAADSIITSPKFGYDEQLPGVDLMIDINFFTSATNPYSLT